MTTFGISTAWLGSWILRTSVIVGIDNHVRDNKQNNSNHQNHVIGFSSIGETSQMKLINVIDTFG
jgi:hypothetical protein